jgi:FkbM family methyltransferase
VISVDAQYGFVRATRSLAERHGVAQQVAAVHAMVGAEAGKLSAEAILSEATHFEGRLPPSLSMASLMEAYQIDRIDFLKMDIEGSEFALFAEDTEWVRKVHRIAMEVHPHFGDARLIAGTLRDHGFHVELRDELLRHARVDRATYLHAHR